MDVGVSDVHVHSAIRRHIPDTSCAATLDAFQASAHTLGGVRGMAGHGLEECIRERKERAIRGGVGLR